MKQLCITIVLGTVALSTVQPAKALEQAWSGEGWAAAEPVAMDSTTVAQADAIAITNIQLEETDQGFALRLDTRGQLPSPQTAISGDALIVDLPNAVLQLAEANDFFIGDPAAGIALVTVTTLPDSRVQIVITGADAPPDVDIVADGTSLTVSATPGAAAAQLPAEGTLRIVVTGDEDDGYFTPEANTATRTDTSILDTPQSIQVIPQQVLEDQQIIRVDDALRNVSGIVGRLDPFAGTDTNLTIRGFTPSTFSSGAILRDGFRVTDNFGTQETANIEQIEVIKGPSSVLYGQTNPGGIINLVTKRPLSEPFYELELQAGSFGLIRPSLDISGPLTDDRALR